MSVLLHTELSRLESQGTCPLLRPPLPALISNMSSHWPAPRPQMAVEEMFPGPQGSPRLMEAEIGEYCNGIFDWSLGDGWDDGSPDILMSRSFIFSCSLDVAAGSDLVMRPTKSSPIKPEEKRRQCLACVEGWRPVIRALVPVSIVRE